MPALQLDLTPDQCAAVSEWLAGREGDGDFTVARLAELEPRKTSKVAVAGYARRRPFPRFREWVVVLGRVGYAKAKPLKKAMGI